MCLIYTYTLLGQANASHITNPYYDTGICLPLPSVLRHPDPRSAPHSYLIKLINQNPHDRRPRTRRTNRHPLHCIASQHDHARVTHARSLVNKCTRLHPTRTETPTFYPRVVTTRLEVVHPATSLTSVDGQTQTRIVPRRRREAPGPAGVNISRSPILI